MRERIALLGGALRVESRPGQLQGTRLIAELPLPKGASPNEQQQAVDDRKV